VMSRAARLRGYPDQVELHLALQSVFSARAVGSNFLRSDLRATCASGAVTSAVHDGDRALNGRNPIDAAPRASNRSWVKGRDSLFLCCDQLRSWAVTTSCCGSTSRSGTGEAAKGTHERSLWALLLDGIVGRHLGISHLLVNDYPK